MTQPQIPRRTVPAPPKEAQDDGAGTAPEATDDDIMAQTDELLDEIDTLLEDQSVLVNFRQRSGQ